MLFSARSHKNVDLEHSASELQLGEATTALQIAVARMKGVLWIEGIGAPDA